MFKHGDKWKIIFLDIDGVICLGRDGFNQFNTDALTNLKRVIDETGAKIVISSSWRTGDIERTKHIFPEWLREYIIDETVRYDEYVKATFKVFRGNEIATWVYEHLEYPWKAWSDVEESYKVYNENNSFIKMNSNNVGTDFTYVILDDDNDMMYFQKDWFVNTNTNDGLTNEKAEECIKILNKI